MLRAPGEIGGMYSQTIIDTDARIMLICDLTNRKDDIELLRSAFIQWAATQPKSLVDCTIICVELARMGHPLPFDW